MTTTGLEHRLAAVRAAIESLSAVRDELERELAVSRHAAHRILSDFIALCLDSAEEADQAAAAILAQFAAHDPPIVMTFGEKR